MNAEINFYRQIFKDFMPSWSERGGYIDGFKGYENLFPEMIAPIPIQFAPASSLDGLLIDLEHAPSSPQLLANYIQTLAPGGISIVHLTSNFWNRKKIYDTFNAAGFEILFFAKIPRLKYIYYDSGYFKSKGIYPYIFFDSFPFTPFTIRGNYFILAKKNFYKNLTDTSYEISIILILPKNEEQAKEKLLLWEKFLSSHKIHNIEIIIIENFKKEIEFSPNGYNQIQLIHLYETTFLENAIYAGIYKSNGKILLLDMDENLTNPEIFFEVFHEFLKNHRSINFPLAVYSYPKQEKNHFFKKILNKIFYGIQHPNSKFRLYNQKCLEIFYKYHPYVLKQNPYLIEKEIKKNKGKIIEIPYYSYYEPLKKNHS